MSSSFNPNTLKLWFFGLAGLIACFFAAKLVAEGAEFGAALIVLLFVLALLVFKGYRWWWILVPVSFSLGGVFYFGFKIHMYELGFVLGLLPIVFASALNHEALRQNRAPLHRIFRVFTVFLIFRVLANLFAARFDQTGGYGNILRHYSPAIVALVFVFLFYQYGYSNFIKNMLFLMLCAYGIRVAIALFAFFFPAFLYIPYINYVLPGAGLTDTDDLRASALGLGAVVASYIAVFDRGTTWHSIVRAVCWTAMVFAFFFLLLGGGRTSIGMFLCLPVMVAVILRRYLLLTGVVTVLGTMIVYLNLNPTVIEGLEFRMQRTIAVLIFKRGAVEAQRVTESSDLWHSRLREIALERWSRSPITILFGVGVRKLEPIQPSPSLPGAVLWDMQIQAASDSGAYESGWFTVLASMGVVGLVLFISILWVLLKGPLVYLTKKGMQGYEGGICFLATYFVLTWFLFGWIYGGYPLIEIVFGIIANAALQDLTTRESKEKAPSIVAPTQYGSPYRRHLQRFAPRPM